MKHIINYLGALLAVILIGTTFTACSDDDDNGSANVGLGIKAFFPTKVVTNQPITINGSGFDAVTEIEFPGGLKVTNFEIVSFDMIRVNAPAGLPAEGGKIKVRTANDEAESRLPLTIGHTNVTGFSKQPGESAIGGELITVYGTDLEFINAVELLDPDSVPQLIDHKDFYRKGTSNLVFRVPPKKIYTGTFVGYLYTYDGQKIPLPELAYEPSADGGHMEIVRTVIWKNDDPEGNGSINWNGTYRFGLDGKDGNNECIATFPQDVWDKIKTGTFYMQYRPDGDSYQIRVTTGWWSVQWLGADNDIAPWNMSERIMDNGDGLYYIEVNFDGDPIVDALDDQHLLFTGSGYTPMELYFEEEVWVDGPGDVEVKDIVWSNGGTLGDINWSGDYRFATEGFSTGEECYVVPADIWERLRSETFFVTIKGANPQIRVTSGWWSTTWTGKDIQPGNDLLSDNGDGTWTLTVDLAGDPLLDVMNEQHLLFTGSGYSVEEIYFIKLVPGGGPKEVVFWTNDGSAGSISWNGTYRFGLDGKDGNNECIATLPQDIWDKVKNGTFYMTASADADWYNLRITTGWWSTTWTGADIGKGDERLVLNDDGTFTIEINFSGDPILDSLDDQHLLFTGEGYTPLKLFYYE